MPGFIPSVFITWIVFLATVAWCQKTPPPGQPVIGPGDVLSITALNADEISKQWRVSGGGDLNLPMIGTVKASGRTLDSLEKEIASRLNRYLYAPHVSVHLAESISHPVIVSGAVSRQGVLQIPGPSPLHTVVMLAGGPTNNAGAVVTVTRKLAAGTLGHHLARASEDGQFSVVELSLVDVLSGVGADANLLIQGNDLVSVAEGKRTRMVHVSGEVVRPGGIELVHQETVSLTKAIAIAGGLGHNASAGKCILRHIDQSGAETAFTFVDVKRILSGKSKDIELSDGDILIVPSSQMRNYLQTISQSAASTGIWVLARL